MANSQLKVKEFVESIKPLSLFGGVDENSFESAESERRELERNARIQRKKIEEEMRREEEEKRRQEYEDFQFALELQEKEKWNKLSPRKSSNEPRYGVGRGSGMRNQHPPPPMRWGRGQPAPQLNQDESPSTLLFKKEQQIKSQILQADGFESIHSNSAQLQVWQGQRTPEQPSPTSDSTPSQGQFEDANSVFSQSSHSNSSPFQSVSSSKSSSPLLMSSPGPSCLPSYSAEASPVQTTKTSQSPHPVSTKKSRKPRCAANFSNPLEIQDQQTSTADDSSIFPELQNESVTPIHFPDFEEDFEPKPQDRLAVLGSLARPLVPPRIRMSDRGVSINDLRASRRVTDPGVLRSELLKNIYSKADNTFMLNKNEFPPL